MHYFYSDIKNQLNYYIITNRLDLSLDKSGIIRNFLFSAVQKIHFNVSFIIFRIKNVKKPHKSNKKKASLRPDFD